MAYGIRTLYYGSMFGIEHRKGQSVIGRETSLAPILADALHGAAERARKLGADNIRVCDENGEEITIVVVAGTPGV